LLAFRSTQQTAFLAAEGSRFPLASIVVVEIKRPGLGGMASDEKNPIHQALEYVARIRAGGVKTVAGRPIPPSADVPAFCYVLADLTEPMRNCCANANLRMAQDGMSFFGFNEARSAWVEVISFDGLLKAANERNRAFLDKLQSPAN
jgi:hypothetical protein